MIIFVCVLVWKGMIGITNALFFRTNTTCNNLLRELRKIWVEIGESEAEKDRMLMELERECLQIYQRKVDEAANSKARLHQSVAAIQALIASLVAALGVLNINSPIKVDKSSKSLKEKLAAVTPLVENLRIQKEERLKDVVVSLFELWNLTDGLPQLTHIQPDTRTSAEKSSALIDSGLVDPSELLGNIETQINKIKGEVQSRKDIVDRLDRWLSACEEETWLEEYNMDVNRYSAGRGGHVNLKRAERARVTINKIPAMVDNLIKKTLVWEDEAKSFLYDGVRLVNILEGYILTRKQQEEDKKRYRDQKKRQDLLLTQRESIYGSKPIPRRSSSFRKPSGYTISNGNGSVPPTPRRSSVGTATPDLLLTPRSYSGHHRQNGYFKEVRRLTPTPLNFVAIQKEDTVSTTYTSIYSSEPDSSLQG
ncbi:BnaC02g34170D [Brassica napus]|uniref:(rape) hypothetical protein n=1 Tax=Brassica napus TaxID=3708 RepID=A0A078FTV9_BRANA|nr:unnamed protein product [Brassica napus]CDY15798.1 BnaC02g34170D [Brassica napus]